MPESETSSDVEIPTGMIAMQWAILGLLLMVAILACIQEPTKVHVGGWGASLLLAWLYLDEMKLHYKTFRRTL